jgi:hypothetical protein
MFCDTVYLADGVKVMKSKAYGWLAAAVLAAGLNASYHDGGLEWAHRAVDGVGRNVSAVLALASGHADQFLAEAQLATAKTETPACRLTTAWARIQTRLAQGQTRLARMQSRFTQTGLAQTRLAEVRFADSSLAQSQSAWDQFAAKSEEISAQREAAMTRIEAQRVRMEADTERHLHESMATARVRPVAAWQVMNLETGCRHLRVNVPNIRIPQVHVPEINVPNVHIPQVHIPEINVPSVAVDAGSDPI